MAHILLVEDDDILSDMLAAKLKAAGHKVTVTEDGGDAVERIGLKPDLIVLDCALPTLSGAAVIRAIKDQLQDAEIPVVLMSARANEDYIQSMLLEGAAAYLVKPLNLRRFLETVEQQLLLRSERLGRHAA